MANKDKLIYKIGDYRVWSSDPRDDGTVLVTLSCVRNGHHVIVFDGLTLMNPPPRPWNWWWIRLEQVFFGIEHAPRWDVLKYEDAVDEAIAEAERRASDDSQIDYQRRIEAKIADIQLRQQAVDEIEAGLAPRQITGTSRESE